MPIPDNTYDLIKDFQTGIGTVVGLIGVGATLYMNFRLTNRKRDDDLAADRIATRTALLSELQAVLASVQRSNKVFTGLKAKDLIAFPRAFSAEPLSRAYRAILSKIGLLTPAEIEKIVLAYSNYEDLSKMSEETSGEAQTKLTEEQKQIAFNAYVKGLSTTLGAVEEAISTITEERVIASAKKPTKWQEFRNLVGI